MRIVNYPVERLPYSNLFEAYLNDFNRLSDYFEVNPFDMKAVSGRAESFSFKGDRAEVVSVLREYNAQFDFDHAEAARENLDRLEDPEALAVVTGQQPGIYGGPLFTIFKTVTVLCLAPRLERALGRPVIPVFWIGDEDHDFEEVSSIILPNRDQLKKITLGPLAETRPPVSELRFDGALTEFRDEVRDVLYDTDFSNALWKLIDNSYTGDNRMDVSFGSLLGNIFGDHGLVLAGSNFPAVKRLTRECLKEAITGAGTMRKALEGKSRDLEQSFHRQVTIYDSNLFYLDGKSREKIVHDHDRDIWHTRNGKSWKEHELTGEINKYPERFSPNVFLRPVLQDRLLPTIGYVGGPGEIAYYAQMKEFYHCFDMRMPPVYPRLTASFIEPAIDRIMDELPFEMHEYKRRIEDLESEYVDRTEQVDIEMIFKQWKEESEQLSERYKEQIKKIDPTMENAAGKAEAVFIGELDKLKGKLYRSVKSQEQTQIDRIHKIKTQLFPEQQLQERTIGWIYFMNKYGIGIWDTLLEELPEDLQLNSHKLIYL